MGICKAPHHRPIVVTVAIVGLLLAGLSGLFAQPAAAATGPIAVTNLVCPDGFDAASATYDDLIATCVDPGMGVTFSLIPDGSDAIDGTTDGSGNLGFDPIDVLSGSILQAAPEGALSRVFCVIGAGELTEYDAAGNTIGYSLADDDPLSCTWFSYTPLVTSSVVSLTLFGCPSDFDAAGASFDGLTATCDAPLPGVPVSLMTDAGDSLVAGSAADGTASFTGFAPGFGTLAVFPDGDPSSRVFCESDEVPHNAETGYHEQDVSANQISYGLDAGYNMDCLWFVYEASAANSIVVTAYACPDGEWTSASLADLQQSCTTPHGGVPFALDSDAISIPASLTDDDGAIAWDVPAGIYNITQTLPPGYDAARVFCSAYPTGSNPNDLQEFIIGDDVIQLTVQDGFDFSCSWFDFLPVQPEVTPTTGPASLTINVYTCQSSNDPIDPKQTLVAECNLGTEDIPFTLDSVPSQGAPASASTGSGGQPATIAFSQLGAASYRLTQQTPDDIALSYISQCTSDVRTFSYPFSPFAIIEPQGRLNIELLPGENLQCDWYNVQAPASSALTITAYTCSGDVVDPSICDPTSDIGIQLASSGAATQVISTGPDGVATFDGSGDYTLSVVDRDACSIQSDALDADGNLTLDPSSPVAVTIYFCNGAA